MKRVLSLTILAVCYFSCGATAADVTCPEKSRPHSTECNKYFKCIKLPNNTLKWITLTCQEGLIYDDNLRSCAIPDENWDCTLNSEEEVADDEDESNVYGIENLNVFQRGEGEGDYRSAESDDFLEVIDGDDMLSSSGESRSGSDEHSSYDEVSNFSGDGSVAELVTQSTPASLQMITTQVQRVTQLMENHPKNNGDGLTADDLNSYLDVHNIQTKSPNNKFDLSDKTPIPQNGKIHPEIMSEILSRQTQLNTVGLKETTLAMDDEITQRPVLYMNKEPLTEIQLKGGQGIDGTGAHQIVVNRPEGAVLFNVPAPAEKSNVKEYTPYLSADILKTILEISKQMVTQKNSNNQENHQPSHPVYYAIPFPVYSPPNYNTNFVNNSMITPATTEAPATITPRPHGKKTRRKPSKGGSKMKNKVDFVSENKRIPPPPQQSYNPLQQSPLDYYTYYNNYQQNYPSYAPANYYQPYAGNDRYTSMYSNRFSNLYGNFYENRPLVSDSSAGSYVDHSAPYRKESFPSPYGSDNGSNDSDVDDEYDALRDESDESENGAGLSGSANDNFYEDDTPPPKDPTSELICSYGLTRQANKTDCMRYYVCNAKTKEVFSYSCPSTTAFNDQTKFCDAKSFAICKKMKDRELGKLNNKKYFQEAHKALQQAKRLADMVRKKSQKILKNKSPVVNDNVYAGEEEGEMAELQQQQQQQQQSLESLPQTFHRQRPNSVQILPRPSKRPVITRKVAVVSKVSKASVKQKQQKNRKKKKVKCRNIGNIPDPEDSTAYWHCFESPDQRMKRIHKVCSPNLVFCAETRFCSPSCR